MIAIGTAAATARRLPILRGFSRKRDSHNRPSSGNSGQVADQGPVRQDRPDAATAVNAAKGATDWQTRNRSAVEPPR